MSEYLEAITARKTAYIEKLLSAGIYKTGNKQLYELTLNELEEVYEQLNFNQEAP